MNNQKILEIKQLKKSFAGLDQPVLDNINLSVKSKEKIAITGVSGSGKSTLLHLMAGLETPDHGFIKIADKNLKNLKVNELSLLRNKYLGFIYQFHHLLPDFSVKENIMMPFIIRGDSNNINISKLFSITKKLGLGNRINHYPNQLSGGERQRVAIARAIITSPEIILADEPTGNLDNKNANLVQDLIIQIADEYKVALILSTHDNSFAQRMDKIYKISNRNIIEV